MAQAAMNVDIGRGHTVDFRYPLRRGKVAYHGYYTMCTNDKETKQTVAKQIKLENENENMHKQLNDILGSHCLSHKNLLHLIAHLEYSKSPTKTSLWIISEYCDPLVEYLKKTYKESKQLSESECLEIMIGCAKGVSFLHSRKPAIIHGNIHPANIHVEKGVDSRFIIKISDYLITQLYSGRNLLDAPSTTSGKMVQKCYRPPEEDGMAPAECSYDVFSLGAVFHALLTHDPHKTQNSPYLFPVIPDAALDDWKRNLLGDYIAKCEEMGKKPQLFSAKNASKPVQNIIAEMLCFKESSRRDIEETVMQLQSINLEDDSAVKYSILETASQRKELEGIVDDLVDKLGNFVPPCIQHLDASKVYFRINVNVDMDSEAQAREFIEKKCDEDPSLIQYLHYTQQSSRPQKLCGMMQGIGNVVEPGSVLIKQPLDQIEESLTGDRINLPFLTLGCFAEEQGDGSRKYAITSNHGLHQQLQIGEVEIQNTEVCSIFRRDHLVPLQLARSIKGITESFHGRLVDIAICELTQQFKGDAHKQWYLKVAPWVFDRSETKIHQLLDDEELEGLNVRKWGAKSGHTTGVVVRNQARLNVIQGLPLIKVFLVEARQQGGHFTEEGDSGAIVLDDSHEANSWAFGIVCENQANFEEADTGCQANVTFCARLKDAFEDIQQKFGIQLNIVTY